MATVSSRPSLSCAQFQFSTQKPLKRRAPLGSFTDAWRACAPEAAVSSTACDEPAHMHAFFRSTRLETRTLKCNRWASFFSGAKPPSPSRLSFPLSLSLFLRLSISCVQRATPSTHATQSTCVAPTMAPSSSPSPFFTHHHQEKDTSGNRSDGNATITSPSTTQCARS